MLNKSAFCDQETDLNARGCKLTDSKDIETLFDEMAGVL
jgi:hypothetical protein